jgi:hypothetical protein
MPLSFTKKTPAKEAQEYGCSTVNVFICLILLVVPAYLRKISTGNP